MREIAVHQLLSGFSQGDALSHEALALQGICRDLKFSSEIFAPADRTSPDMGKKCRPLEEYPRSPKDVVIYHYSLPSPASHVFSSSPARKALVYHNITPAEFYAPFDSAMVTQLKHARQNLREMALKSDVVWAASQFNANELKAAGVGHVKVFTLLFTPGDLDVVADKQVLARLSSRMQNILFVGRIAPHKCVEELITAFAWYQKKIESSSRLIIVGSDRSSPTYFAMLRMYAGELGLPNVWFQRFASPAALAACYQSADLFASASRHEGYSLPLVEAMYKGVPVIARNTGGTPEAMGGAGVMYDDLKAEELAELFGEVLNNQAIRRTILESQSKRVAEVLKRPIQEEFLSLLSELIPNA